MNLAVSPYRLGIILVFFVCFIDASSFPVIKDVVSQVSPSVVVEIRFLIAAILCTPFLRPLNFKVLRDGAIVGLFAFSIFATETIGLETVSSNRAIFTYALSLVFVILIEIFLGRVPSRTIFLSAALAFTGITLMSWTGGEPLNGELWMLLCAFADALYIVVLEYFAPQHSPLQLAAVILWVLAILGFFWSLPHFTTEVEVIRSNWTSILYLAVICTAAFAFLENLVQQSVPASEVAIFRALVPVMGSIVSYWMLGETFSGFDFLSAGLVLFALFLILKPQFRLDENTTPELMNEHLESSSVELVNKPQEDPGIIIRSLITKV